MPVPLPELKPVLMSVFQVITLVLQRFYLYLMVPSGLDWDETKNRPSMTPLQNVCKRSKILFCHFLKVQVSRRSVGHQADVKTTQI